MQVKTAWLTEITKILWKQAVRNKGTSHSNTRRLSAELGLGPSEFVSNLLLSYQNMG